MSLEAFMLIWSFAVWFLIGFMFGRMRRDGGLS